MLTDPVHVDDSFLKSEKQQLAYWQTDGDRAIIPLASANVVLNRSVSESVRTQLNSDKGTRYAY